MLKSIQKWLHNNFLKKYGFGWLYRDFFTWCNTFGHILYVYTILVHCRSILVICVWGLETREKARLCRTVSRQIHIFTYMLRQCTCIVFILQFQIVNKRSLDDDKSIWNNFVDVFENNIPRCARMWAELKFVCSIYNWPITKKILGRLYWSVNAVIAG